MIYLKYMIHYFILSKSKSYFFLSGPVALSFIATLIFNDLSKVLRV